jgi:hypothetical protein
VQINQGKHDLRFSAPNQENPMAESFKDKVKDAGHKIAETATKVGHRIEEAAQTVKHKVAKLADSKGAVGSTADIREHMEVYGSCGNLLGKVDHVEGDQIKLTKNDSPDGQHHLIPLSWVAKVHDHIHLNKDCGEARAEWQNA